MGSNLNVLRTTLVIEFFNVKSNTIAPWNRSPLTVLISISKISRVVGTWSWSRPLTWIHWWFIIIIPIYGRPSPNKVAINSHLCVMFLRLLLPLDFPLLLHPLEVFDVDIWGALLSGVDWLLHRLSHLLFELSGLFRPEDLLALLLLDLYLPMHALLEVPGSLPVVL